MRGLERPDESALACVVLDTLDIHRCTYRLEFCKGHMECLAMFDANRAMVTKTGYVQEGGGVHKALVENFISPGCRRDLLGVVLRVRSLEFKGIEYELVSTDPKDNSFIIMKPTNKSPLPGNTRSHAYDTMQLNQFAITYFPRVLTGQRVASVVIHG